MARPELQEHERRTARLPAPRVTMAELAHVQEKADTAGIALSDYIRTLALFEEVKPPKTKSDALMLTELNRIGVNINQIAHAANIGRNDEAILRYAIDELVALMVKVDKAYS